MPQFASWQSYRQFARRVKLERRYFRDAELERFCKTVIATSVKRTRRLDEGTVLCRSQRGEYEGPSRPGEIDNDDQPFPLLPPRMIPRHNRALEGRANPKGISYLYVASDQKTAVAESRAGIGEAVSVGFFKVVRHLRVVDCSVQAAEFPTFYFNEPSPKKRAIAVWSDIDRAFSHPVNRSDDAAEYVPTQILAELFKCSGFDGIVYRSSLAEGHNLVLFDLKAAALTWCCLVQVTKFNIEFEQSSNPYVVDGGKISWNTMEIVGPVKKSKKRVTGQ